MEMSSKRMASIDICKGICILMVILGHQFEKFGIHKELQYIQTFHMPLLVLLKIGLSETTRGLEK